MPERPEKGEEEEGEEEEFNHCNNDRNRDANAPISEMDAPSRCCRKVYGAV